MIYEYDCCCSPKSFCFRFGLAPWAIFTTGWPIRINVVPHKYLLGIQYCKVRSLKISYYQYRCGQCLEYVISYNYPICIAENKNLLFFTYLFQLLVIIIQFLFVAELEEAILGSQLPLPTLWLRVETLRAGTHWVPLPSDSDSEDPQRLVFPEDVNDLIHSINCPHLTFRLVTVTLSLLKVGSWIQFCNRSTTSRMLIYNFNCRFPFYHGVNVQLQLLACILFLGYSMDLNLYTQLCCPLEH